mmetsp:Transcript_28553/g.78435  ORF Transcript_28553/g.78435 Transcript_28553/m.78435 type:complete len:247 (+) Transcript_28553:326-1066(+)
MQLGQPKTRRRRPALSIPTRGPERNWPGNRWRRSFWPRSQTQQRQQLEQLHHRQPGPWHDGPIPYCAGPPNPYHANGWALPSSGPCCNDSVKRPCPMVPSAWPRNSAALMRESFICSSHHHYHPLPRLDGDSGQDINSPNNDQHNHHSHPPVPMILVGCSSIPALFNDLPNVTCAHGAKNASCYHPPFGPRSCGTIGWMWNTTTTMTTAVAAIRLTHHGGRRPWWFDSTVNWPGPCSTNTTTIGAF